MSNGAVTLDYEWDNVKYGFYLSKKKCILSAFKKKASFYWKLKSLDIQA